MKGQILRNIRDFYIPGAIGLFASKTSDTSTTQHIIANAAMAALLALSSRERGQYYIPSMLGLVMPTALDLGMQYFGIHDYVRNPVIVAVLLAINIAHKKVDGMQEKFNVEYNALKPMQLKDVVVYYSNEYEKDKSVNQNNVRTPEILPELPENKASFVTKYGAV